MAPDRLPLLTHAAAVAAAEAVAADGVAASCKWPNDLLGPDGRKLAGVLAESATADGFVEWAVVGLGLNANPDPAALPAGATSLRELAGGPVDRRAVTQAYLESFDRWQRDLDDVVDAWRDTASTIGREVWVRTADEEVAGEAVDVDETGALLVETDEHTRRMTTGEVVHLRSTDAA